MVKELPECVAGLARPARLQKRSTLEQRERGIVHFVQGFQLGYGGERLFRLSLKNEQMRKRAQNPNVGR